MFISGGPGGWWRAKSEGKSKTCGPHKFFTEKYQNSENSRRGSKKIAEVFLKSHHNLRKIAEKLSKKIGKNHENFSKKKCKICENTKVTEV